MWKSNAVQKSSLPWNALIQVEIYVWSLNDNGVHFIMWNGKHLHITSSQQKRQPRPRDSFPNMCYASLAFLSPLLKNVYEKTCYQRIVPKRCRCVIFCSLAKKIRLVHGTLRKIQNFKISNTDFATLKTKKKLQIVKLLFGLRAWIQTGTQFVQFGDMTIPG